MTRLLAAFVVAGLLAFAASAKVVYVDKKAAGGLHYGTSWSDAFTDIQSGVNAAVSGDEVWVAEGSYTATSNPVVTMKNNVTLYGSFVGTETAVMQRDLYQYSTTIDGEGVRRCVTAADATLDGFVMANGYATQGGALYMKTLSSVRIVNSSLVFSHASEGAGVYAQDCSASFEFCTFYGNSATNGAGMFNTQYTISSIDSCSFLNNTASGRGGGIYSSGSSQFVVNTVFQDNSATAQGGAVYGTASSGPMMTNCTLTENTSASGGSFYNDDSPVTLKNCILWGNSGGEIIDFTLIKPAKGSVVTYSCVQGGFSGGTSIINADPLFVNPATGNLHLQASSPCIDKGTASGAPSVDKNGYARPQGTGYDLGAYEFIPSATLGAPVITTNNGLNFTSNGSTSSLTGTCTAATHEIRVNGSPLGVAYTSGATTWSWSGGLRPGLNVMTIVALDSAGAASPSATITIQYNSTSVASITSPLTASSLSGIVTVRGSAAHSDFAAYALYAYAIANDSAARIVQQTTPVTNGTLGTWDTSTLVGGAYRLMLYVWDKAGNVARTIVPVTILRDPAMPMADFEAVPTSGPAPLVVLFRNTSDPGSNPFTAFAWNFGDGKTSTERDPVHTYTEPGVYNVILSVTTAQGTIQKTKNSYITVTAGALEVGRITPRIGSTTGGTEVTITGRGFTSDTQVLFDTTPASSVTFNCTTELVAVSPAHATGVVAVTISRPISASVPASSATLSEAFLYTATNAVSGTVQNIVTGAILSGATCTVLDADTSAQLGSGTTDAFGRFTIAVECPAKKLRLQVGVSGYDTRSIENFYAPMLLKVMLYPTNPQAPSDLVVLPGTDQIMLYWKPNRESDLAGYKVYRNDVVVAENLSAPHFRDTAGIVSGTSYIYRVIAEDTTGNVSDPVVAEPVTAGEIELWIPNTSGLPGVPAGGVWIPINISNARHISPASLSMRVTYDATIVDPTQVRVEPTGITAGVPFVADTTTSGIINITSTASAGSEALSGEGNLFSLFLPIRASITTGSAAVTISAFQAFSVTSETIPVSQLNRPGAINVSTSGRLGDMNNNGELDNEDLAVGFDIILGRNSSPTTAQREALDLSGDHQLDAADIVLLNRLVAGLAVYPPQIGAEKGARPGDLPLKALRKLEQNVTVTVPASEAAAGALVEVPITLDHAEGLSGVGLTVAYPPELTLDSLNGVALGTLTAGFAQESNTGESDVQIAMCNLGALPAGSGSVVRLLFRVSPVAEVGDTFQIKVNDVSLRGPYGESFEWTGTVDSSDGTITVKGLVDLPLVVRVLDKTTNIPINGSTLVVTPVGGSGSAIISEADPGVFQVLGLSTNTYQFTAQATGFSNYSETRGVNAAEQSQVDFQMTKAGSGGCYAGRNSGTHPDSEQRADLVLLLCAAGLLVGARRVSMR